MELVSVPVPPGFTAYVEATLVRLGYLYPDVAWSFDPDAGSLAAEFNEEAHCGGTLIKEASYQLYREKIFQDTLEIRGKIYEAI